MDIVIHSGGMPFNGATLNTKSLGGSESCAYYMARELARRGHNVKVFTDSTEEGEFDGVIYCHVGEKSAENPLGQRFAAYATMTPHDVLIIQRHPLGFHKDYASKINILQMHDIAVLRNNGAFAAGAFRIDMVTAVSEYHREQIESVYKTRPGFVQVVPNGVDADLYKPAGFGETFPQLQAVMSHVEGPRYLYQSRPERGLEHLVRPGGIMEALEREGSKGHLFICGYDHNPQDVASFTKAMMEFASQRPNVTVLGPLTKRQLALVQKACDALLYPTEFPEVSCITAMEAMHAGLPFISSSHAALPETCKESGSILLPLKDGKADEAAFCMAVHSFEQNRSFQQACREAQLEASVLRTWEFAVDVLEDKIGALFADRSRNPANVLRHCIETSDIVAAERADLSTDGELNAIAEGALDEVNRMYEFARDPQLMADHYALEEKRYHRDLNVPEGVDPVEFLSDKPELFDMSTRHARFRGTMQLFAKALVALEGVEKPRVVEFGCSHGLITLSLARMYPELHFVGVDFMPFAARVARRIAEKQGITNVEFHSGGMDKLIELGPFDIALAPEVIEHQPDYLKSLNDLVWSLTEKGSLILTTPAGKWEWNGLETYTNARQHLHHFERQDIAEIFREFNPTIVYAPSGATDRANGPLGWWVYSIQNNPKGTLYPIDYDRKLALAAPRETVSLCMIVRNAEEHIVASLRSAVQWVDEVVIAVDNTTTDRTRERIADVQAEFPHTVWKVFDNDSPTKIGFDAARNATVDASCGDWILWMDADETLIGGGNIHRLLRRGAYLGFALDQHHMSQLPATHISTDHPTRLFRRDSGARFYGVVHEHPETKLGDAVPYAFPVKDVSFVHYGFTDERTRRGRYMRNFPLLLRDLEAYPDRPLNKFLYIRDLSQGIAFEGEATGRVSQKMMDDARKVVDLFDKMVTDSPMLRLTLDAIPYYSTASATLGNAFEATIKVMTGKPEFAGVKAVVDVEGVFHSRETYKKLLARIAQETTVNYDAEYI